MMTHFKAGEDNYFVTAMHKYIKFKKCETFEIIINIFMTDVSKQKKRRILFTKKTKNFIDRS